MSPITTHVLDTSLGKPAQGIPVSLEFQENGSWRQIASGATNADGRIPDLLPVGHSFQKGQYRITFSLESYFAKQSRKSFYPAATIVFVVDEVNQHYHVPLLLSGFGFSTYRGS